MIYTQTEMLKIYKQSGSSIYFPNYAITHNGCILIKEPDKTIHFVEPINDRACYINGIIRIIDDMLAMAFIGETPFPVITCEASTKFPQRSSFLTYHIEHIIQDEDHSNIYYLDNVEFRIIPHCRERYIISNNGVIYDLIRSRFLHRYWRDGYPAVSIASDGSISNTQTVHRLVYMTWIGEIPSDMEVDHINDCRFDPRVKNLQLLSGRDNSRKTRISGGRKDEGFTVEQMEEVCKMIVANKSISEIAAFLGKPASTRRERHATTSIVNKLRFQPGYYDDLKAKYDMSNYDSRVNYTYNRLSDEDVAYIKSTLENHTMTGRALAAKYGISPSIITRIKQGNR